MLSQSNLPVKRNIGHTVSDNCNDCGTGEGWERHVMSEVRDDWLEGIKSAVSAGLRNAKLVGYVPHDLD